MRVFLIFPIILIFFSCTPVKANTGLWGDLPRWIDKYPSETIDGISSTIFNNQSLKKTLQDLLSPNDLSLLRSYTVSPPVKRSGNFIIIHRCMPHNCPAEAAMIVIEVTSRRLWAAFFLREEGRVTTRWYGNVDDYLVIPEEIRKEFYEKHGS
jgi:hypothetical protein